MSLGFGLAILMQASAEVRLPAIIGDHMVIQRDSEAPIWGWAQAGASVTVAIAGQSHTAETGEDDRWMVRLEPLPAGGPHELTITVGDASRTLGDVMVGEVWIASGQSNMEWSVAKSGDSEQVRVGADYPGIRLMTVKRAAADEPQDDFEGAWARCSPETVNEFSAVAYHFGRMLHGELDVPIGLIHTSWGGTPVEAWTSRDALQSEASIAPLLENYAGRERRPHQPAVLYNGMIAPLVPYAFRGAIWYQGESNAGRAYQYRTLFPLMITDWRSRWDHGEFPFYFVQLANFKPVVDEPGPSDWAELREAQTMTLAMPNTGMAVIIDIGEADDIHPANKHDVGKRLALWALAKDYGKDIVHSGPLMRAHRIEGERVIIEFDHIGEGLVAKDGDQLTGFTIAGSDEKFVWANAKIDGDRVIVWHEDITSPAAVRYAWADNPVCNLYNKSDLPASPFRTDEWPGITHERD